VGSPSPLLQAGKARPPSALSALIAIAAREAAARHPWEILMPDHRCKQDTRRRAGLARRMLRSARQEIAAQFARVTGQDGDV
jgi:predicted ABC-class ATPase